jgi:hypothetical protein
MSTGFQPAIPPMPSYSIAEGTACRYCSRVRFEVTVEYRHSRMRLSCDYSAFVPLVTCPSFSQEPGVD